MKKAFGYVITLNLCNKKDDHMMYAYSDMECSDRHNFLSFQAMFCSFVPLLTPKIKMWKMKKLKWKKCKKTPGYIILLHRCTNNQDHVHPWYSAWFLRYEVQQAELFWIILKISKMRKNPGGVIILHKCTKNNDHLLYCSRDVTRDGRNCYLSFWAVFSSFTPLQSKQWKC